MSNLPKRNHPWREFLSPEAQQRRREFLADSRRRERELLAIANGFSRDPAKVARAPSTAQDLDEFDGLCPRELADIRSSLDLPEPDDE